MNHYLCVGAGGTASYLFPVLHRFLRGKHGDDFILAVIDADTIKTENLARQNHGADSIGRNKAVGLIGDAVNTIAIQAYLGPDNIEQLIQEGTTVIVTVDNFPVRARIQDRVNELQNAIVINAGNEEHEASVQLWLRQNGQNVTPPIGFLHPEISYEGADRALMSCEDIDALAGGGQTAIANHTAATSIMMALNQINNPSAIKWHELHANALTGEVETIDYRSSKAWSLFSSPSDSSESSPSSAEASSSSATTRRGRRTPSTTA